METQEILTLKECQIMLNPLRGNFNNEIVEMEKEVSKSDDILIFTFGDNKIELIKSEFPIYSRNSGVKDLDVKINGFEKSLNTLTIEDDCLTMTFY